MHCEANQLPHHTQLSQCQYSSLQLPAPDTSMHVKQTAEVWTYGIHTWLILVIVDINVTALKQNKAISHTPRRPSNVQPNNHNLLTCSPTDGRSLIGSKHCSKGVQYKAVNQN